MPRRGLASTKVCVCPECGAPTKASLRNGHLYEHSAPERPGICPKSGEVVLTGSELKNSYECACGTWVRITHKDTLAQHSMPEGERCPLSGEPIVAPAALRPVVDGPLRMVPPPRRPKGGRSRSSAAAAPACTRSRSASRTTGDVAADRPTRAVRAGSGKPRQVRGARTARPTRLVPAWDDRRTGGQA
jgi:hypothetical protein